MKDQTYTYRNVRNHSHLSVHVCTEAIIEHLGNLPLADRHFVSMTDSEGLSQNYVRTNKPFQ